MQVREMRRKEKAMTHEDALAFLKTQNEGVLALSGTNGYPYAVPLNFAFLDDETIMFHCAPTGQKLDFIGEGCEACFTVGHQLGIITEGKVPCSSFRTPYESVVAFGTLSRLEGEEKIKVLTEFVRRFMKHEPQVGTFETNYMMHTGVLIFKISHLSGKRS